MHCSLRLLRSRTTDNVSRLRQRSYPQPRPSSECQLLPGSKANSDRPMRRPYARKGENRCHDNNRGKGGDRNETAYRGDRHLDRPQCQHDSQRQGHPSENRVSVWEPRAMYEFLGLCGETVTKAEAARHRTLPHWRVREAPPHFWLRRCFWPSRRARRNPGQTEAPKATLTIHSWPEVESLPRYAESRDSRWTKTVFGTTQAGKTAGCSTRCAKVAIRVTAWSLRNSRHPYMHSTRAPASMRRAEPGNQQPSTNHQTSSSFMWLARARGRGKAKGRTDSVEVPHSSARRTS